MVGCNTIWGIEARFTVQSNGCRIWTGGVCGNTKPNKKGIVKCYGCVEYKCKSWATHRLMYTAYVGSIPKGFEIHHICGNSLCGEPTHLKAVTRRQHIILERMGIDNNGNVYPILNPLQAQIFDLLRTYEWASDIATVLNLPAARIRDQVGVIRMKLNLPGKDALVAFARTPESDMIRRSAIKFSNK